MKRQKKQYQTPKHPWQATRIQEEAVLTRSYGLKNKKELWRASSKLRNWRSQARTLVGLSKSKRGVAEKQLFTRLIKLGLLNKNAGLDDILSLTIEQVLDNRLQTQVYKQGLASTAKQARQFITHCKVLVNGTVVTAPSYAHAVTDKITLIPGFKPVVRVAKKEKEDATAETSEVDEINNSVSADAVPTPKTEEKPTDAPQKIATEVAPTNSNAVKEVQK